MYMYVGHVFLGYMLSLVCCAAIEQPLLSITSLVVGHLHTRDSSTLSSAESVRSSIDLTDYKSSATSLQKLMAEKQGPLNSTEIITISNGQIHKSTDQIRIFTPM